MAHMKNLDRSLAALAIGGLSLAGAMGQDVPKCEYIVIYGGTAVSKSCEDNNDCLTYTVNPVSDLCKSGYEGDGALESCGDAVASSEIWEDYTNGSCVGNFCANGVLQSSVAVWVTRYPNPVDCPPEP